LPDGRYREFTAAASMFAVNQMIQVLKPMFLRRKAAVLCVTLVCTPLIMQTPEYFTFCTDNKDQLHGTRAIRNAHPIRPSESMRHSYPRVSKPVRIMFDAQEWEGNQQPHTLSVVLLNRVGFKYWGYYGLTDGRGTGLARSNDLLHWTKYQKNPLWLNARWTSAISDPGHPDKIYFAITRDYDTACSHIVLAVSDDGIHLTEIQTLVAKNAGSMARNQNPNLYCDPRMGKIILTFYRGNDTDSFDIISKSADHISDLAQAQEKVLLHETETLAAPSLVYVQSSQEKGVYYLSTEIYPGRYTDAPGRWEIKVFRSDHADGPFVPVANNPVQAGGRACLLQHIFGGHLYGFQSHLTGDKWEMEMIEANLP
jgi:hypothetical protein